MSKSTLDAVARIIESGLEALGFELTSKTEVLTFSYSKAEKEVEKMARDMIIEELKTVIGVSDLDITEDARGVLTIAIPGDSEVRLIFRARSGELTITIEHQI